MHHVYILIITLKEQIVQEYNIILHQPLVSLCD